MGAKLHKIQDDAAGTAYVYHCPGCRCGHAIPTRGNPGFSKTGCVWNWNGSLDAPSFTPSINYTDPGYRCHSVITDGIIHFCADCDHPLAGQHVPMEDWDEE